MTRVVEATAKSLKARRKEILQRLDMTYEELAAKADDYSLVGEEWSAWEEIREIDFLLKA